MFYIHTHTHTILVMGKYYIKVTLKPAEKVALLFMSFVVFVFSFVVFRKEKHGIIWERKFVDLDPNIF